MTNGSQSGNASNTFEAFYEGWLVRQEHFLDELLSAQQTIDEARDEDLRDLVCRVLSITSSFTTRNRNLDSGTFYWFSRRRGILPTKGACFGSPGTNRRVRIARLREVARVEERALNDKLAKIHESVAAPLFMDAVRRYGRAGHREIVEDDAVIKSLKLALETVVENANLLRTTMATKLVDLLSSGQAVKFLTAVMQFQLKIRSLGLERDAEKQREMSGGGGGWSPISSKW
ncbi:protein RESPONSE TO ABA AND SALT 1-like [Pyrus communis]|uniref:protein RESPONSE TO ABA AND SALT 1-like n=1 Tax=Pyrus communis TaxID=23211 RepID=UPI0035BEEC58